MDEEIEKPFPIEFIVILLLVAIANDVAEIFFDILDFTGVGLAGEAIMEPANFVLDLFFTGIFWWKVGPGGGTITQYIGDLLEPLLIPGRTISVGLGMWIANHPNSAIGKVATTATSIESGNIEGVAGETERVAAGTVSKEAASAEKELRNGGTGGNIGTDEIKTSEGGGSADRPSAKPSEPESSSGENEGTPKEDIFKNPYENPIGTAAEELNAPPEEEFHEGKFVKPGQDTKGTEVRPKKVIDISTHPDYQKNNQSREEAA
jgi:hypothetical protein